MCDNPEFDELGLTKWDRRLLDPIVEFHSMFQLPKPDGWSRTETGARYMLTPSGLVSAEDMSGKLIPKYMAGHLTVVGRDDSLVESRRRAAAIQITYETLRSLEANWLKNLEPRMLTLQYKPIAKSLVRVVYVPNRVEFQFLGAGRLFFSILSSNKRYLTREIIDERAREYFERKRSALDVGPGVAGQ